MCHALKNTPHDHPVRIYYKALKKELRVRNVKDPTEIREAIKKVEHLLPYPPRPRQIGIGESLAAPPSHTT
jgi:hypothetical protein